MFFLKGNSFSMIVTGLKRGSFANELLNLVPINELFRKSFSDEFDEFSEVKDVIFIPCI
jgi:hypothetical protein